MAFKKRKNIPFKHVKFGLITSKAKKSPKFNQYITVKRLIELDRTDIKLKCKKCKFETEIDVVNLLIDLNPKILVKGGDYKSASIVGADFVKSQGGNVEIYDYEPGKSTSSIIKKIKNHNE